MAPPSVCIVTTAHSHHDGRLVRHQKALNRGGYSATVLARPPRGRLDRLLRGPLWAVQQVGRMQPDAVILPDPELHFLAAPFVKRRTAVICDVHEDYAAVAYDRGWIPAPARPLIAAVLRRLRGLRHRLADAVIVADQRIDTKAILVSNQPNSVDLPIRAEHESGRRLVYVGDVRASRGMHSMLDLLVRVPDCDLDIVGPCANIDELHRLISSMDLEGRVRLHGRLGYEESWAVAAGALAGLSLLEPTPAFVHARPTKIWEYWTIGLPVLASDLPGQGQLIREANGGIVGPNDVLAATLNEWTTNPEAAHEAGRRGQGFAKQQDDGSEGRLLETVRDAIPPHGRLSSAAR